MKKSYIKQLFAALFLTCCATINAHDFVVNGVYYNIISSSAELACVTFKGNSYDEVANEYSGDVVIPKMVINDGETYDVIFINADAFRDCTELTSICKGLYLH